MIGDSAKDWTAAIVAAQKAFQPYHDLVVRTAKAHDRSETHRKSDKQMQVFWANMQVLRPSVYQRSPTPVVAVRNSDSGGDVVREAARVLERVLRFEVEEQLLHDQMLHVRDDLLMGARGALWVLDTGRVVHVCGDDFLHEPARKWEEVSWVARRAYVSKEEGVSRFGDDFLEAEFKKQGKERSDEYKSTKLKAEVWEIWDRVKRRVLWVSPTLDAVLDEADPLFDVPGFFPCPRPAYGTLQHETLIPVPDYEFYSDQLVQIDKLTARISGLSESLRLRGFYAAGSSDHGEALEALLSRADDMAVLVPVASNIALGGGSARDAIVWMPLNEVAGALQSAIQVRQQIISDVYEITGLSDIMRGVSSAQETLGAQNLKAQFGSVRVREKQNELVRVAAEALRIKAEVVAESYPLEDLQSVSAVGDLPDEAWLQIYQVLQSQRLRPYLLDIETDSTIAPNEHAEKESRMEFLQAVGGFLAQASGLVAQAPETAPFMAEMLKFGVGAFRAGRDLTTEIEQFSETIKAGAAQGGQGDQKPDPEAMKAQVEAQKMQMEQARAMAEMQLKQQELEMRGQEAAARQQAALITAQSRQFAAEAKAMIDRMNITLKAQELGIKQDDATLKRQQAEIQAFLDTEELELERVQQRPVGIG